MNTLRPSKTQPDVYQINAPGVAAALTRSNGKPSAKLRSRIAQALKIRGFAKQTFKRGESGKWYVRISSQPMNIGPVCEFNRQMTFKYGTGGK